MQKKSLRNLIVLAAALILAFIADAQTSPVFVPFSTNLDVGAFCTIGIDRLHPMQAVIGMTEVRHREKKMMKWGAEKLDDYLREKIVPLCIGPGGNVYITDHHHLVRILGDTGLSTSVYAVVKGRYDRFSEQDFWRTMRAIEWVYTLDENGNELQIPEQLPKIFKDLRDDPYRSLAWAVRDAGGYEDTEIPFADFKWAGFFRSRVKIGTGDAEFKKAVRDALAMAHDPAAKKLPGFKPN
jgi:hypothetical protein